MKKVRELAVKIGILLGINIVYLVFMTATFMLPTDTIVKNVEEALNIWVDVPNGGESADEPIFEDYGLYFDSHSDMIWADMATVSGGDNPLESAVSLRWYKMENGTTMFENLVAAIYYRDSAPMDTYSRYWNLNVGFLKLLFSATSLSEIRFGLYWLVLLLLLFLLYRVSRNGGVLSILPLVAACMLASMELHSISLSFAGDFIVMLCSMIALTYMYERKVSSQAIERLFLVMGSLAFAIGPMVAPVVTVGMCLVLMIQQEKGEDKLLSFLKIVKNTIWWIIGYGATMLIKQGIALLVLGAQDGTEETIYWFGLDMGIGERLSNMGIKFARLFSPAIVKVPVFVILVVALLLLGIRYHKKSNKHLQLIFVGLYPVFWMLLVPRHSIHYFTTTIIMVSVYALLSILVNHIDVDQMREKKRQSGTDEEIETIS